ncbi:hypothetical protein B0H12DRAFT_171815 [Mycena haematopus]|nr:hypothetical protein B0H12DRAFT_171815 [Mycena haematopus]
MCAVYTPTKSVGAQCSPFIGVPLLLQHPSGRKQAFLVFREKGLGACAGPISSNAIVFPIIVKPCPLPLRQRQIPRRMYSRLSGNVLVIIGGKYAGPDAAAYMSRSNGRSSRHRRTSSHATHPATPFPRPRGGLVAGWQIQHSRNENELHMALTLVFRVDRNLAGSCCPRLARLLALDWSLLYFNHTVETNSPLKLTDLFLQ